MAFLRSLGNKIIKTSHGVVQKTKDTAEIIKLNDMITEEEKNITDFYSEIGNLYFNLHSNSYEPNFENMILGIKNSQAKIEGYSEQIKKLKGIVQCNKCGSDVPYGVPFCSSCGSKMTIQAVSDNSITHCFNCGATLELGVSFCANCGAKVAPAPINADATVASYNICSNCGKELATDKKFCTGCGSPVDSNAFLSNDTNCVSAINRVAKPAVENKNTKSKATTTLISVLLTICLFITTSFSIIIIDVRNTLKKGNLEKIIDDIEITDFVDQESINVFSDKMNRKFGMNITSKKLNNFFKRSTAKSFISKKAVSF